MFVRDKKREAQIAKERERFLSNSRKEHYQTAKVNIGTPKIVGIQGLYANSSFDVTGTVILGRNASKCHLVYPNDTHGISNVHCALQYTNGDLYLIDKGSSYGTFVSQGLKLSPNQLYKLRDGEIFYLANERNSFMVRL